MQKVIALRFHSSWCKSVMLHEVLCPDAGRKEGKLKRPLAYITAHWGETTDENMKLAAKYCRAVYDVGYQPICPLVMHSLFLRDAIPQEHKDDLDMSKDYLYRASLLVVCGSTVDETVKNDIAIASRLHKTATTLDGILTVKGQGRNRCPRE